MRLTILFCFCLALAGCASSSGDYYSSQQSVPPYTDANGQPTQDPNAAANAAQNPPATSNATASTQKPVSSEPKPWASTSAPAPAQAQTTAKYPLATKVAGKTGIVHSPYAPYAGDVDVRGIAPGTQVRCPYTGKIFIVP